MTALRELLSELMSTCEMIGYATSGNERTNHRATRDKLKDELLALLDAEVDGGVVGGEVVGSLNVRRFRCSDSMVNHDFDYYGNLPDGTYNLYTHPQPVRCGSGLT
jgi:hypothetical protein